MTKQIRRVVSVGSSVNFSCYGKIVWSYNKGELPLNVERHNINRDKLVNSIVYIDYVTTEDAGTYTCSMDRMQSHFKY